MMIQAGGRFVAPAAGYVCDLSIGQPSFLERERGREIRQASRGLVIASGKIIMALDIWLRPLGGKMQAESGRG